MSSRCPAPVTEPPPPPVATWSMPYVIKPIAELREAAGLDRRVHQLDDHQHRRVEGMARKRPAGDDRHPGLERHEPREGDHCRAAERHAGGAGSRRVRVRREARLLRQQRAEVGDPARQTPTTRTATPIRPAGTRTTKSTATARLSAPRTIWQDSQGESDRAARLPRTRGAERQPHELGRLRRAGRRRTGLHASSIRARPRARTSASRAARWRLRLADANGNPLPTTPAESFRFRTSTAYVASRRLDLADLPIDTPIARRRHADRARPDGARPLGRAAGRAGRRAQRPARRRRCRNRGAGRHRSRRRAQHPGVAAGARLRVRAQQLEDQRQRRACDAWRDGQRGARQRRRVGAEPALHAEEAADDPSVGDRRREEHARSARRRACCGTSCPRSTAPRRTSRST